MQSTHSASPALSMDSGLSAANLPAVPLGEVAIGNAAAVSLQLAGSIAIVAFILWGIRKSFELSFGIK
jgi:hypothetical protein